MKALVVFLLLHNTPTNGQDVVMSVGPMPEEQCYAMAGEVWRIDWPAVPGAHTVPDNGPVPVTDAACEPATSLNK